jgi:hypothetical protein
VIKGSKSPPSRASFSSSQQLPNGFPASAITSSPGGAFRRTTRLNRLACY